MYSFVQNEYSNSHRRINGAQSNKYKISGRWSAITDYHHHCLRYVYTLVGQRQWNPFVWRKLYYILDFESDYKFAKSVSMFIAECVALSLSLSDTRTLEYLSTEKNYKMTIPRKQLYVLQGRNITILQLNYVHSQIAFITFHWFYERLLLLLLF